MYEKRTKVPPPVPTPPPPGAVPAAVVAKKEEIRRVPTVLIPGKIPTTEEARKYRASLSVMERQIAKSEATSFKFKDKVISKNELLRLVKGYDVDISKYITQRIKLEKSFEKLRSYGYDARIDEYGNLVKIPPEDMSKEQQTLIEIECAPEGTTFKIGDKDYTKAEALAYAQKAITTKAYEEAQKAYESRDRAWWEVILDAFGLIGNVLTGRISILTLFEEFKEKVEWKFTEFKEWLGLATKEQVEKEFQEAKAVQERRQAARGRIIEGFAEVQKIGTWEAYMGFFAPEIAYGAIMIASFGIGAAIRKVTPIVSTWAKTKGITTLAGLKPITFVRVAMYAGMGTVIAPTVAQNVKTAYDADKKLGELDAEYDAKLAAAETETEKHQIRREKAYKKESLERQREQAIGTLLHIGLTLLTARMYGQAGYRLAKVPATKLLKPPKAIPKKPAYVFEYPKGMPRLRYARPYKPLKPYQPDYVYRPPPPYKPPGLAKPYFKGPPRIGKPVTTTVKYLGKTYVMGPKGWQPKLPAKPPPILKKMHLMQMRLAKAQALRIKRLMRPPLAEPGKISMKPKIAIKVFKKPKYIRLKDIAKKVPLKPPTKAEMAAGRQKLVQLTKQVTKQKTVLKTIRAQLQEVHLQALKLQKLVKQSTLRQQTLLRQIKQAQAQALKLKAKTLAIQQQKELRQLQIQKQKQALINRQIAVFEQAKVQAQAKLKASMEALAAAKAYVFAQEQAQAQAVAQAKAKKLRPYLAYAPAFAEPRKRIRYIYPKPPTVKPYKPYKPIKPKPLKPFIAIPPLEEKPPKVKPIYPGYDAYVLRDATKKLKAKYVKVTDKPRTQKQAHGKGAIVTDETVSRTFKVKPSKKPAVPAPTLNFAWTIHKHKFRKPVRKGTVIRESPKWIEKTKYAIDTPGEFRGITVEGWKALEKKRREGTIKRKRKTKMKLYKPKLVKL